MSLRATSLLVALLMSSAGALRADDVCRGRPDPLAQAIKFMQGMYTNLGRVNEAGLQIEGTQDFGPGTLPFFGHFTLAVLHYTREPGNLRRPSTYTLVPHTVATGDFRFFVDCTPMKYAGTITLGETPNKLDQLRRRVESHPEWDGERILQELRGAGAAFTPDQKEVFLKTLPLAPLESFLGRIEITRVEFKIAEEGHEGNFAHLYWLVDVKATAENQPTEDYGLYFDPFDGTLMFFSIDPRTWRLHARH